MSCGRCGNWKSLLQVRLLKLNHTYLLLLCNFSRIIAIHRPIGLVDAQQKALEKNWRRTCSEGSCCLCTLISHHSLFAFPLQSIMNHPKANIPPYRTMPLLVFFLWRNPYFEVGSYFLLHFFRWSAFVAMAAVNHKAPMPWSLTWRNLESEMLFDTVGR